MVALVNFLDFQRMHRIEVNGQSAMQHSSLHTSVDATSDAMALLLCSKYPNAILLLVAQCFQCI